MTIGLWIGKGGKSGFLRGGNGFFIIGIGWGNGFLNTGIGGFLKNGIGFSSRNGFFKSGIGGRGFFIGNGFLKCGSGFFTIGVGGITGFSKPGIGGNGFLTIGIGGGSGFLKTGIGWGIGFLKIGIFGGNGFLKKGIGFLNFPSSRSAAVLNSSLWDGTPSPANINAQNQHNSFQIIRWNNEIDIICLLAYVCFISFKMIGFRDQNPLVLKEKI